MDTQHPFMQGPNWKEHHVLQVQGMLVEHLPQFEHGDAIRVLASEPWMISQPELFIDTLGKFIRKPAKVRREIYKLSQSEDRRDRGLALARTVSLPPPTDARVTLTADAIKKLNHCVKSYPNEALTPRYTAIIAELRELKGILERESRTPRPRDGTVCQ